jgi:carbon storage regulator
MIGDEVAITILGIKDSRVRVGIDAPKTQPVHRREIYDLIRSKGAQSERR